MEMRRRSLAAGEKLGREGFGALSAAEWLSLAEPVLLLGGGAGALTRQTGKVAGDLIVNDAAKAAADFTIQGIPKESITNYMRARAVEAANAEETARRLAPLIGTATGGVQAVRSIPTEPTQ
jgi:hypothetical protein